MGRYPGFLMPESHGLGLRDEAEELGDGLVFGRGLLAHDPEARPADDGVLGSALDVGIVGKLGYAEVEFTGRLHGSVPADRLEMERDLAGGEE